MINHRRLLYLFLVAFSFSGVGNTSAVAEVPYVAAGTAAQPANVGNVEGVLNFRGQTGQGTTRDAWFSFTLLKRARLKIAIDQVDVTFDLRIVGSQGIDGVLISTAFSHAPSVEYDLNAGTYLLRTYADKPKSYTVTVKAN